MYRLLELTKINGSESQAIYPFESSDAMEAEYETKAGALMKSENVEAALLIMLNGILDTISIIKIGEDTLSPRLIEVKTPIEGEEEVNVSKYDTEKLVSANYHSKLGSAMKNVSLKSENLKGINGNGDTIEFRYWINPKSLDEENIVNPEE